MFDSKDRYLARLADDRDEAALQLLLIGLRGDAGKLDTRIEANLKQCATMALFHGRQMNLASQDAFDALAAMCLVLGERRIEFFDNIFIRRMILNPNLTAREKLNRVVEVVIGTVPRPRPATSNDNPVRESA